MQDIIFWGKDYEWFLLDAEKVSNKLVTLDVRTKKLKLMFSSTPAVVNKKGEFMVLVRANTGLIGELNECVSIQNLGAYVAVLDAPPKRAIYDRIYPNAPYDTIDYEGNPVTITPPERFGEFAGDIQKEIT